jgi:hypothetical protein
MMVQPLGILWPTFALVALIFTVWFILFVQRIGHMRRNPPRAEDIATGEAAMRYFTPVEMPANNLRNLFEMPVLYFALVPLLLITHHANHLQVLLAWIFVVLRGVAQLHSHRPEKGDAALHDLSCLVHHPFSDVDRLRDRHAFGSADLN